MRYATNTTGSERKLSSGSIVNNVSQWQAARRRLHKLLKVLQLTGYSPGYFEKDQEDIASRNVLQLSGWQVNDGVILGSKHMDRQKNSNTFLKAINNCLPSNDGEYAFTGQDRTSDTTSVEYWVAKAWDGEANTRLKDVLIRLVGPAGNTANLTTGELYDTGEASKEAFIKAVYSLVRCLVRMRSQVRNSTGEKLIDDKTSLRFLLPFISVPIAEFNDLLTRNDQWVQGRECLKQCIELISQLDLDKEPLTPETRELAKALIYQDSSYPQLLGLDAGSLSLRARPVAGDEHEAKPNINTDCKALQTLRAARQWHDKIANQVKLQWSEEKKAYTFNGPAVAPKWEGVSRDFAACVAAYRKFLQALPEVVENKETGLAFKEANPRIDLDDVKNKMQAFVGAANKASLFWDNAVQTNKLREFLASRIEGQRYSDAKDVLSKIHYHVSNFFANVQAWVVSILPWAYHRSWTMPKCGGVGDTLESKAEVETKAVLTPQQRWRADCCQGKNDLYAANKMVQQFRDIRSLVLDEQFKGEVAPCRANVDGQQSELAKRTAKAAVAA